MTTRSLLTTFFSGLVLTGSAFATDVLRVPDDHPTIQAAIDAAANGQRIEVRPGVYNESLNLRGKALTLTSLDPENREIVEATVIDATDLEDTVILANSGEGADTVIRGFTLTGGIGHMRHGYRRGGAVFIWYASPVFERCRFIGNTAAVGGAVAMETSSAVFRFCDFEDNTATGFGEQLGGGAVSATGSWSEVVFQNSCFRSNLGVNGAFGGAAVIWGSATLRFHNCLFVENRGSWGGVVFNSNGRVFLKNCTAIGNVANSTGAVVASLQTWAQSYIHNSLFWENVALTTGKDFHYSPGTTHFVISHSIVNHDSNGYELGEHMGVAESSPFADVDAGDYRLAENSPAIDFGSNEFVADPSLGDLFGRTRIVPIVDQTLPRVDAGALEVQASSDPRCVGDVNGDGRVDYTDLLALLAAWGVCDADCSADFNGDGFVDMHDLFAVIHNWGVCP